MINMVKLTKFHINTEWHQGVPTNTEVKTDVWINPSNIRLIQMQDYFTPGEKEDTSIEKVLISLGGEDCVIVDEGLEDVLKIVQGL